MFAVRHKLGGYSLCGCIADFRGYCYRSDSLFKREAVRLCTDLTAVTIPCDRAAMPVPLL